MNHRLHLATLQCSQLPHEKEPTHCSKRVGHRVLGAGAGLHLSRGGEGFITRPQ